MLFGKKRSNGKNNTEDPQIAIQAMLDAALASLDAGKPEQAFSTYKQIVQLQPNVTAQYNLGSLYAQGLGTEQDFMEAAYWFHQAAKGGDAQAAKLREKSTMDYIHKELGSKSARDVYEEMLRLVAYLYPQEDRVENANKNLYGIAGLHFNKEEYDIAAKLFRAAAEFGDDGMSENYLGVLYNAGAGVEKNDLVSLYWFDKAADNGIEAAETDRDGIFNAYKTNLSRADFVGQMDLLASWCSAGTEDVPKDADKAGYWREHAMM